MLQTVPARCLQHCWCRQLYTARQVPVIQAGRSAATYLTSHWLSRLLLLPWLLCDLLCWLLRWLLCWLLPWLLRRLLHHLLGRLLGFLLGCLLHDLLCWLLLPLLLRGLRALHHLLLLLLSLSRTLLLLRPAPRLLLLELQRQRPELLVPGGLAGQAQQQAHKAGPRPQLRKGCAHAVSATRRVSAACDAASHDSSQMHQPLYMQQSLASITHHLGCSKQACPGHLCCAAQQPCAAYHHHWRHYPQPCPALPCPPGCAALPWW